MSSAPQTTSAGIRIPAIASVMSSRLQAVKSPWMISGFTRERLSVMRPENLSRFAFATENLAARPMTAAGSCFSPSRMIGLTGIFTPAAHRDHRSGRIAVADGETEADGRAEGVADQDRFDDSEPLQDLLHPLHVGGHLLLAGAFGLAVAGQIDGRDIERIFQRRVLLNPVRVIPPEPWMKTSVLRSGRKLPLLTQQAILRPSISWKWIMAASSL